MALPQRIATSAIELCKQVLNSRHIEPDLAQLCSSGKGAIDGNGNYAHLFGGEPSTPRMRRKLYKHEHEQFRSVKANDLHRNVGSDLDPDVSCRKLERQLQDASLDMEKFTSQLERVQRDHHLMDDERLFTYTYHKTSRSHEAPEFVDPEASFDQATQSPESTIYSTSSARERVQLISSHLLPRLQTKPSDTQALEFGLDSFLEECSHLRRVASETRREQEAVSRADMARLHGSRIFTHRVPAAPLHPRTAETHIPQTTTSEESEGVEEKEFECPFPHCHHILTSGAYWISKWDSASDLGTLELGRAGSQGLMCVHDGCLECFVDGSEWRAHIMEPHHERVEESAESLTVRMQRVWGKRRAVR